MAAPDEFPKEPITLAEVNGVANGDFEYALKNATNSGWKYYKRTFTSEDGDMLRKELEDANPNLLMEDIDELYNKARKELTSAPAETYCTVAERIGAKGSCGLKVDRIGLVGQTIDSIFDGFKLKLAFNAQGEGCVNVLFMGNGEEIIKQKRITVDSQQWSEFMQELVAPDGTKRVEIEITSAFDTPIYVDDISLIKVK